MNKPNLEDPLNSSMLYIEEIKNKNIFLRTLKYIFVSMLTIFLSLIIGLSFSLSYVFIKNILIPNYVNDSVSNISPDVVTVSTQNDNSSELVKDVIKHVNNSIVSIATFTENTKLNPTSSNGIGSGIVFHKTLDYSFIVTNYHVIENTNRIGVSVNNSQFVPVNFVGKDVNSDLAVLSIHNNILKNEGINLSVATFTDSSNVKVGDYVIAIGNAVGEGITSTFGIISATSRDIVTNNVALDHVLQTTAAINPGNSGGALVNLNGEVIGINTAKVSNNSVDRVGYTISSSVAMPIIENIMNNTNPASLGVTITDISNVVGNFAIQHGALVIEVLKGSSAEEFGIIPGDIITNINNTPIISSSQLIEEMKKYSVSDVIELKLFRNGKVKTIDITLIRNLNSGTSF